MNPDDPLGLIGPQQNDPLGLIGKPAVKPMPVPAPVEEEEPGYAGRLATHALNAAQGIPGMEALEAAAGALGSHLPGNTPMSYTQSLEALRGMTGQIGGKTSAVEHALGTVPLLPFLPANPTLAGSLLGGADAALSADPDQTLAGRGVRTAVGAGAGALVGKGADMLLTGGRAALMASPEYNLLTRQTERAASAKALYGAALKQGAGKTSPEIQAYLKEPDVAEIVSSLKGTREFQNVPEESPEMLDAIFKTFSDRGATVKKGLLALNPTKPNIGRFQARDIKAAQDAGLQAMDTTMPAYREAVADFAKHRAAEDAVGRGYDALRSEIAKNIPAARNLLRAGETPLAKWAKMAGPDETQAAVEGILGGVRKVAAKAPLRGTYKALSHAPTLLRAANDASAIYGPKGLLAALRDAY